MNEMNEVNEVRRAIVDRVTRDVAPWIPGTRALAPP